MAPLAETRISMNIPHNATSTSAGDTPQGLSPVLSPFPARSLHTTVAKTPPAPPARGSALSPVLQAQSRHRRTASSDTTHSTLSLGPTRTSVEGPPPKVFETYQAAPVADPLSVPAAQHADRDEEVESRAPRLRSRAYTFTFARPSTAGPPSEEEQPLVCPVLCFLLRAHCFS